MNNKLLTRKDIAEIIGISVLSIKRNEKSLGLYQYRVKVNSRIIFYQAWSVIPHLKKIGLMT